jgi:AcrR family transcriptional regulator
MLGNMDVLRSGDADLARLPAAARRFQLRSRIVDAAVREVAERGYDGSGADEMARRAGVSIDAFHELFADKDEVLLWAYDAAASYAVPQIARALRGAEDRPHGAVAAVTTYLAILDCDRAWAMVCLRDVPSIGSRAAALRDAARRPIVAELAAWPRLPGARPTAAEDVLVAIDAVAVDAMANEPDAPLLARRHELAEIALAPFGEPSPPRDVRVQRLRAAMGMRDATSLVVRGGGVLERVIRDAAVRRDGATLWHLASELRRRREAGAAPPGGDVLEQRALDGLDNAWFFGLGVEDEGGVVDARAVMRYVIAHPGASEADVCDGLGEEDRALVARTLAALEAEGLLRRDAQGGEFARWRSTVVES